jgi:hypothetical protein
MHASPVVLPCLFPPAVTDACRRIAPVFQAALQSVRLRVQPRPRRHRRLAQGLARPWLDVCPHAQDPRAPALPQPEERRLRRGAGAAAALPREASAPAPPPFFPPACGCPWWPATMETSAPSPAAGHGGAGCLRTRPWRHGRGLCCASSCVRARAWARWGFERVRPRPYRPSIHTRRGGAGPAQIVSGTASQRRSPAGHRERCRSGGVSSRPCVVRAKLSPGGPETPSGQRRGRTVSQQ